jgi:transcriptional regulator with XRE-family HTH domain
MLRTTCHLSETNRAILYQARNTVGLSQKKLAHLLGVSSPYLCQVETGVKRSLDISLLKKWCEIINLSPKFQDPVVLTTNPERV